MPERWAVIVAVSPHLHARLDASPFAEADALALSEALAKAGYAGERQIVLTGHFATKTAIESRLRKLKKLVKKGDTLLAWRGGEDCWDTLPDDREATSLPHADWVQALLGTKATQTAFFFADALTDELRELFAKRPDCAAFFSRTDGDEERSANKRTLWGTLVAEAFAGQARKAADDAGRITPGTLQRYIEDELPRRLRKHFESGASQTPVLLGGGDALADLADAFAGGDASLLDPTRLRRVVFRGESFTRIKELANYRKSYSLPEQAGPSARKFFARIAAPDLRADLDRMFDAARETLGTKRKDIEIRAGDDGYGSLRLPEFEYTVFVDLVESDPTRLVWRREAGQFADPAFIGSEAFCALFGSTFDSLAFEFAKPVDVPAFVDRLEDDPPPGVKVKAESDGSGCDLTLTGFAGVITVRRNAVTVRGRTPTAAGLLDLFLQFVRKFGNLGELPALPPGAK